MENKPRRRASKAELTQILLDKVSTWINEGATPEEAVEKLTLKQYDFLINQGVDFDNLLLTPAQQKAATEVLRMGKGKARGRYNKKYPQSKQDLYNGIVEHIQQVGGEIQPAERCNFRDLDFTLGGVRYRIVLSNPRK